TRVPGLRISDSASRNFLSVTREATLGGDQFSAVTGGIADRPARPLQVVGVDALGHAEVHKEGSDGGRADEQVASEALILFVFGGGGVHRKTSGGFCDE